MISRTAQSASRQSWLSLSEGPRAGLDLTALFSAAPFLTLSAVGDGHPVMVIPGFMADDDSTWLLRQYLTRLGYAAYPWGQARNLGAGAMGGYTDLINQIQKIEAKHRQPVSLVGWSLGGVHAVAVSNRIASSVRSVITLGSPLHPPAADNSDLTSVGRALQRRAQNAGSNADELTTAPTLAQPDNWPKLLNNLHAQLPLTSIYSRSDGVVPWQRSHIQPETRRENIEVVSSHLGLGFNPAVYYAIADRLAQASGEFSTFRTSGLRALIYPRPAKHQP